MANIIELNGVIDSWGWQTSNIKWQLSQYKGKDVILRVNSMGGDVNQAMAISQKLHDHGNVVVQFVGMNASASTWMAFGAKKVQIAEDSLWLCHKTSTVVGIYKSLNADEIDKKIDELQKCKKTNEALDLIIAKKYADRGKKSVNEMLDLMSESKWLTASEAKDYGFVDEVIKASGQINNCHDMIIQNCADLSLPVPHFADKIDSDDDNKSSLIDCIINKCKELFAPKEEQNINNNNEIMNKSFIAVNALLNVEGVTENEQNVQLTTEQMQTVNEAISQGKTYKAELDELITLINNVENCKAVEGTKAKVEALINLVKSVPLAEPVVQQQQTEEKIGGECTDPINAVASQFI